MPSRTTFDTTDQTAVLVPAIRARLSFPARVTIKLDATFDGIEELRSGRSPGPVLACSDDARDALHSMVSSDLTPGTYPVIVDTCNGRLAGPFTIQLLVGSGGTVF